MPDIRPLNKELQIIAETELGEQPERVEHGLQAISEWLSKTPHIKAKTDDQFLINFLRGCKYSLSKAKEKLDIYYTIHGAIPEFFANREITDGLISFVREGVFLPLPNTAGPTAPRLILFRQNYDGSKFKIYDVLKWSGMILDILTMEDDTFNVAGQTYVIDMNGTGSEHFHQFTPGVMKRMSMAWQEGYPFRIKGLVFINTPSVATHVINAFKMVLNEKIRSRLSAFDDQDERVHDKIPKRLLPNEYGGEAGPMAEITEYWVKKLKDYEPFFKEDIKYGTDESLRPGKPKTSESLFGISGSFRKLQVD